MYCSRRRFISRRLAARVHFSSPYPMDSGGLWWPWLRWDMVIWGTTYIIHLLQFKDNLKTNNNNAKEASNNCKSNCAVLSCLFIYPSSLLNTCYIITLISSPSLSLYQSNHLYFLLFYTFISHLCTLAVLLNINIIFSNCGYPEDTQDPIS